jgi:hypothetical protein
MTALVLDHRASNRTWDRFVLPGVILALGLWTALAAGYRVITLPDGNQTADYLINWEGGPVRRGALGSLLLVLPVDGVSLLWVVAALQVGLLLALYGAVAYLAASYAPSWNLAILVLSPAFLLFPVLNPAESARKELFGLVALALLGISVRRRIWGWLPWVAIGTFTIGVWAHEVNVLLLPSVLALGVIAARRGLVTKSWAVAWGIVVASVALSALVFSLLFPADSRISAELCRSLIDRGLTADYCGGAVTMLAMSPLDALRWVVTWYPAYFLYIPLGAMALLAVYLWAPQRWTWWLFAVQWGALIPLFIFAIDYGRWIYVGISAVTLVILATGRSSASRQPRVPWPLALAYVGLWSLPAVTPVVQDPLLTRMIGHAFLQALPWVNRVL